MKRTTRWMTIAFAALLIIAGAASASALSGSNATQVTGETDGEFTVESVPESVEPGEEFTVRVEIDTTVGGENTTVTGAEFQLGYDNALLEVTNVSEGSFIGGQSVVDGEPGLVDYAIASDGNGNSGSGTVAEITFAVTDSSDAPVGADTALTFETTNLLNQDDESVPSAGIDTTVTTEDTHPPTASLAENSGTNVEVGVDTVSFNASGATDNHEIDRYQWDLTGDETIDVTTNHPNATVDHIFDAIDTQTVTVTVVDTWENEDSASVDVNVVDTKAPTADIAGPTEVEIGETVAFNATDSDDNGAIVEYVWEFDDDTKTTQDPTVNHQFNESGIYDVSVTVVDSGGNTDTATKEVTVRSEPNAVIDATPKTVNVSGNGYIDAVQLNATGSTGENLTYEWEFHDGTTTDSETVERTYEQPDVYDVSLTVTDQLGQTDVTTVNVTVVDAVKPTSALSANATDGIELNNDTVAFNASSATDNHEIDRYQWDLTGDGTVDKNTSHPTAAVNHVFESRGTNNVTVTVVDNSGNTDTTTISVEVVDTIPPHINNVSVDGGIVDDDVRYLNDSSEVTVTVDADDRANGRDSVTAVEVTLNAGFTTYRTTRGADPVEGTDNLWTATLPADILLDEGAYTSSATATDEAANTASADANKTLRYDNTSPQLSAVIALNETSDNGTVTVQASEELAEEPDVEVTVPDGSTVRPEVRADGDVWTGEFNASSSGAYAVVVNGTDMAGNAGSDTTSASIDRVSTENNTVIIYNDVTGTFIRFNTTENVNDTFIATSESEVSPKALEDDQYGIGFLTAQLGSELDTSLENATIHIPADEGDLPDGVTAADVNITYFNETTGEWQDVPTDVTDIEETIDDEGSQQTLSGTYWVATVDSFSTYGTTTTDEDAPSLVDSYVTTSSDNDATVSWDTETVDIGFNYTDELSGVNVSSIDVQIDEESTDTAQITSSETALAYEIKHSDIGATRVVAVTVADEAGNQDTFTREFTVEEPPQPSIATPADEGSYDAGTESVDVQFEYKFPGMMQNVSASSLVVTDNNGPIPLDDGPTWGAENVTATVPVKNGTSYTANLTVVDEWGHERTELLTFTIEDASNDDISGDSDSSGGGGGAGGGGGGGGVATGEDEAVIDVIGVESGATVYIENVPSGENVNIEFGGSVTGSGTTVDSLDIQHRLPPSNYRVEVTNPQTTPVSDTPAFDESGLMTYFTVEAIGTGADRIDGATVTFTVDPASLPDGASEDTVTLYRYADGKWQSHSTDRVATEGDELTYESAIPGFSTFAIGTRSADVSVHSAVMDETELTLGESTSVSADVTNDGDIESTREVELRVDGTAVASQTVEVAAGTTERVTFTFEPDATGTYAVAIDDTEAGSLVVTEAETPAEEPASPSETEETTPGFGALVAIAAVLSATLLSRRRSTE